MIFVLAMPLLAQDRAETEQDEFGKHLRNIVQALAAFEKEVQNLELGYQQLASHYEKMQNQYQTTSSWLEKGKLKLQLTVDKQRLHSRESELKKKKSQLATYYCVLAASGQHKMSRAEHAEARKQIPYLENREKELEQQIAASQKKCQAARARLQIIPQEIQEAEQKISSLRQQLQVFEDKKSWGNLTERLELRAKLSWQQSKSLKLKGEILVQEKLRDDALQEEKSARMEKKEVRITLDFLNR
jgi:chromosome segregation ATPase